MTKIIKSEGLTWAAVFIISLAVLGVYAQTLSYDFVNIDDDQYVTTNQIVLSGINQKSIVWAFTNISHMCWQPLTWLSHMFDCELGGLNPAWHHAHNLLLHLANSLVLFLLFRAMTGAFWRSFLLALLFAVHPLGVDTAAWISERKNLLATLFMFLSIFAYQKYAITKKVKSYLASMVLFGFGLLSKPSIVTLPCVFLLLDVWPLKRFIYAGTSKARGGRIEEMQRAGRIVIEKLPFFALSALYLWIFQFSLGQMQATIPLDRVPLSLRLSNAVASYVEYLASIIWPSNLAVYYPFPQSIPAWQIIAASCLLIAITSGVLLTVKRWPFFMVGWFWFLGTLVPTIGIVQAGLWPARADRWVYMPMIGVMIILVWGSHLIQQKINCRDRLAVVMMASVLLLYGSSAHLQARHWRDSVTLFQRTVEVTENNYVAHDNLGLGLAMKGRFDEAYLQFKEALRIEPGYWRSHQNIGAIYLLKGQTSLAINHFMIALKDSPKPVKIYVNLGRAYANQGRMREAEVNFRRALELEPGNKNALDNLARLTSKSIDP